MSKEMTIGAKEQTKIWNPVFIRVFNVNIISAMAAFMMNTIIPVYAKRLGANPSMVGVIASIFGVTALSMRIFSGPATVSFNKRKIMAYSMMVTAAAYCVYGFSSSYQTMIAGRLLQGCAMGFTGSTILALASDALPQSKLGAGIGYFSLGQAVGSAIGPSIGLLMIEKVGCSVAFFVGASIVLAASLMLFFLHMPELYEKKPFEIKLNNIIAKEAILPMLLILFLAIGFNNVSAFLVLFAQSRNVGNIGLFFTVYAIVMIISRPIVASISDRVGIRNILMPAMILFAISMFMISISTTLLMFLAAAVIAAIGYGCSQPAVQTLCIKSVSLERRGVGGSTNYIGLDLGGLMGPVIAGMIANRFGYANMYLFLIIPISISIALLLIFYKKFAQIENTSYAVERRQNIKPSEIGLADVSDA